MLANREGLFHAYPVDIGVSETRENKLLQVAIVYQLFEECIGGNWNDCHSEGLEITGYHALERRDHTLNEYAIKSMQASLGWDGVDPFWLQDNAAALADHPVQVKLSFEEYNGNTSLRVQFLNPYGSQGGMSKGSDELRRSVGNRLGSKFRAAAGSAPAAAPSPKTKPQTAAPPKAPVETSTMQEAWDAFTAGYNLPGGGSEDDRNEQWFRIIGELTGGKQANDLTSEEWAIVRDKAPDEIIPF